MVEFMMEKIITKVLAQIDDLPAEMLQRIQMAMIIVLNDYEVIPKSTEIVPYTGNPQILKLFLASKKVDGAAKTTLLSYYQNLTKFMARLQKDPLTVTSIDIRMYLAIRESEGLNKNSLSSLLSILKSFYTWLENEEYIPKSPCKPIKSIKAEKHIRKPLSPEDLERLRIACETSREKALVELFYSTGCRLDEVQKLNRDDIDWKNDSCVVMGKGSKEREVYLNAKSRIFLQKYISERKDANPALFVCERLPHARLGRRSIEVTFSELGRRAGINRPVFPHLIRHTTATNALNAGASLTVVQKMLGHESPATTQIYAELDIDTVKAEHKKHVA
jgi:integrase/recombinase XerD